jgi:hypothetical protein
MMELIFAMKGTPEKLKAKEAIICSTNQGFEWFKIQQNVDPKFKDKSWEEFKKKFEIAYYPRPSETRYIDDIKILSFKQDTGECVVEYSRNFQTISQALPHKEHKRFTISRFIHGLHKHLQNHVMIHKPTDLDTAIKLAQQAEEDASPRYVVGDKDAIAQVDVNVKEGKADDKSNAQSDNRADGRNHYHRHGGYRYNSSSRRGYHRGNYRGRKGGRHHNNQR